MKSTTIAHVINDIYQPGVYAIIHINSGRIYVGSTRKTCAYRWSIHRADLRAKRHHIIAMQEAWDKDGEIGFELKMLEIFFGNKMELLEREQEWISKYKEVLFNLTDKAMPIKGRIISEKERQNMRIRQMGNKNALGNRAGSKFSDDQVVEILKRYAKGDKFKEIAKDFNCTDMTIRRLGRRKAYTKIIISQELEIACEARTQKLIRPGLQTYLCSRQSNGPRPT